jgi:catechol-2,3-dioxygenase
MIEAQRFGHIVLAVRDMKKSADFYCRAAGLQIAAYSEPRGQCFMSFGDDHHAFALFQRAAPDGRPPEQTQPGIAHIVFELGGSGNLHAAIRDLAEIGVAPVSDPDSRAGDGGVDRIGVRDPDGNLVVLTAGGVEGKKRLAQLALNVTGLAEARDFYRRVLGIGVISENPDAGSCLLGLDGDRPELALFGGAAPDAPPPDETQPRLIHFAWQLPDFQAVQAAYRELTGQGIPVETMQHNVTNSLYVKDADGHVCELYCDRWEDGFEAMRTQGPMTKILDIETGEGIGDDLFSAKAKEKNEETAAAK